MRRLGFWVIIGCFLIGQGLKVDAGSHKLKVFVSILPQAYFVERIGGEAVDVEVLVGPGQSPATYEPTPKQMARLGRARVYFRVGTPFEKGFIRKVKAAFKNLEIVDTRKGVPLRYFSTSRGDGTEVPDPHIWLDPKRVRIQAATICDTLCRLLPERAETFRRNLQNFLEDLERLDRRIADILGPLKGGTFFVFHPAFGYFGDSYGLKQEAVEIAGKQPGPRQLAELIERARRKHVRVIFVQPQFARNLAEKVARAIGGAVVPIDPLPRDYLKGLERMAEALRKGLLTQRDEGGLSEAGRKQ
ncbi:MAG: zinc ABC transporter substrate-binding protein [Deltaproteobacteria bacterium]|nr:zinc ABC transporter substrate-binding protein [Deltaproteobacteria bacterium]MBW2017984.1 zinc ABC transporter substrate-binding protein [Deltaproteobacteria bacterium]MBW2130762.1 zinc ABC transporter substrate-binding protein [Deltaproteobacteria bacterium]MBW2302614.1 zinc ABC transporter substrate-binding protein [Deltaproteobacteria bacterium]